MKRFLKNILLFFVSIAFIDILVGYSCQYLNSHAKGGDTYNHYYIANEMTDSVLIFGSSRAIHHFNSQILEDSLNTSVYNCGLDGNGIIYNYGRLLTILQRYKPQIIIYDVIPMFDMVDDDCSKYLIWQKRWYDYPGIADIFHDVNQLEDLKMMSNMYRYNTTFLQMLSDNIKPRQGISYKGYKPLSGKIDYLPQKSNDLPAQWSDLKLKYFQKFVTLCKKNNIHVVISYSPWFHSKNSAIYDNFNSFCEKENLDIINLYDDAELSQDESLFVDASHLNSYGADKFSSKFASILKSKLTTSGNSTCGNIMTHE